MSTNLNSIPLLRLLVPFIAGVVWVIFHQPNFVLVITNFGIGLVLYFSLLFTKKLNSNYQFRWVIGMLIATTIFFGAASLTSYPDKYFVYTAKILKKISTKIIVGKIVSPPQIKTKYIKAVLKIERIKQDKGWILVTEKVIVYFQKEKSAKQLELGDVIAFDSKLKNIPPPKNPNEFDFRKYLSYQRIHYQSFLKANNWKLIPQSSPFSLVKFATKSRIRLINLLHQKGLNGKDLAVAAALILGAKDNIDTQLKSAYSSAGAMHVLAVSGLHVGVIFLIFSKLFSFIDSIKYGGQLKGIGLLFILWCYALLTGLSPSVMRASTMFSFIVVAKMTNRNANIFNTLAASAICLLIYNPLLIMAVGFQLSYLAVIGILIIQPWINNWFNFRFKIPRLIWEITSVSIAAQIATFPLGLFYFHQFPNYFMLSNLIVIPLAVIILYLGILTLSFSFVLLLDDILAFCLKYSIQFLNYSVNFIDQLPYSLSENIRFGILDTWLAYLFIISIVGLIAYRKFKYIILGATFLSLFLIARLWFNYTHLNQRKFIIYNIPKHTAIDFIDVSEHILITNKSLIENDKKIQFHLQNNWIANGLAKKKVVELNQHMNLLAIHNKNLLIRNSFFQFYEIRIALIHQLFKRNKTKKKIHVDFLILTKNNQLSIAEILTHFSAKQVIIDASHSSYKNNILVKEAHQLKVNCWSVLSQGAFQYTLK